MNFSVPLKSEVCVRRKLPGAIIALSAVISTVMMLAGWLLAGAAFWCLGYGILLFRQYQEWRTYRSIGQLKSQVMTRVSFAFAIAAPLIYLPQQGLLLPWVSLIITMFLIRFAGSIRELAATGFMVANVPGLELGGIRMKYRDLLIWGLLFLPFAQLVLAMVGSPIYGVPAFLIVLFLAGVTLYEANAALKRRRHGRFAAGKIVEWLESYSPRFMIHWSAPSKTQFQLDMWMPYFERMNLPFIIVSRDGSSFEEAVAASNGAPVVFASNADRVSDFAVKSISSVFYVNNARKNIMGGRLLDRKHIQLLHGDSEKVPSFNPLTAMYDRIYVAGQAAIDRYADNGVLIPAEKFEIVGRPQVEAIQRRDERLDTDSSLTVMYAPTWRGYSEEASYSSIRSGLSVVKLLTEFGHRVLFRPHPYTGKNPEYQECAEEIKAFLEADQHAHGRKHLFGNEWEQNRTIIECFNAVDALISDVSSVANDFLYSGKPLALMTADASPERYIRSLPLSEGVYILDPAANTWRSQLEDMLGVDSLHDSRLEQRVHYLGDFPAESYANAFVHAARLDVLGE